MTSLNTDIEQITVTPQSFADILSGSHLLTRFSELGFHTPTDIQQLALPKALSGKDVIIQAKTGSGKTLAFVVPLIERLASLKHVSGQTSALFIAPTRELAVQIQEVVQLLDPSLTPVLVIGGVDEKKQRSALENDSRLVVGTPGRLLDLIQRNIIKLKQCSYFVLDEADEMLSMGFIDDIRAILSRLPKARQGLFVSATITPRVEMLANSFLTKPEYVSVVSTQEDAPPIEHIFCEVGGDLLAKPHALCDIIETQRPRSAIIFCNTKSDTQLVEVLLRRRGFDARRMNSDLSQSQRQKVLAKIKAEELQLLVATDIAARGLDIAQLDLVINYSLHEQSETYIHRSGRTGRAGKKGRAISLIGPRDFGSFHYLTKVLPVSFTKIDLPTEEEVASARLAHLYEMLRKVELKSDGRANLAARKLLKDLGGIESPADDLVEMIAKLCDFTIGHFVAEEAKSLDEELDVAAKKSREVDPEAPQHESKRDRRERGSKDKRREPRHEDSSDEHTAAPEARAESRRDEARTAQARVRVYIGQGSTHGLNEGTLSELLKNSAQLAAEDIHKVSIRPHYSFLDTTQGAAQTLIAASASLENAGAPVPIEIATQLDAPRNHSGDRGRHRGGRSRRDGDGRNSGNRQGGNRNQSRRGRGR